MKILVRSLVILAILFVMLYVGMNNTHEILFKFPVFTKTGVQATAAFIYFGVFAIGVIGGTMLGAGGSGGSKRGSSSK